MRGDEAWFFTLEFTEAHTRQLLQSSGYAAASRDRFLKIDTSEDLSADYLVQRLRRDGPKGRWIAVVDYLQLLDQQRWKPGLQQQLQTLKQFAVNEGGRIVLLSQVDRYFDERETAMPAADDMRLPNPVKKEAFDHFCAIHDGVVQFQGKTI